MASTWSALKIELLETGQNSGTWGTATNVNLGDAVLGEAITGQATVDFATDADVTITLTDSASTQAARNLRLNITESSTGVGSVRNLILGSGCQIEKFYLINNTGTGAKTVKNTSGTGISVPAGKATLVYNNGTNVVDAASYFTSLTLGSALPVASGGTGLTAGTSGGVLAYTATGTLASSTALAASALVIGGGAGAAPSTTTTGTGVVTALGVNTGTAGAFVVNGGALGSPSSVGTMPAFTLGGTVSGGGNQINNVIIGTSTPLAGAFTTVTASTAIGTASGGTGLGGATPFTSSGVVYASSTSALATGSALTFDGSNFGGSVNVMVSDNKAIGFGFNAYWLGNSANGFLAGYINGSEGLRLKSTGLGIGTTSPVAKLQIRGSGTSGQVTASWILENASSGTAGMDITGSAGASRWRFLYGNGPSTGTNALTESMCILTEGASAGNLGIGTSSPAFKTEIVGGADTVETTLLQLRSNFGGIGTGSTIAFRNSSNSTADSGGVQLAALRDTSSGGSFVIRTADSSGTIQNRVKITETGLVGINIFTTPASGNTNAKLVVKGSGSSDVCEVQVTTNGTLGFDFRNSSGTQAGSITINSSSVAYNTSSDYRLKNTIAPITGALAKVAQLKPCTYKWNVDGSDGEGFIAHELAEVCPSAVTGAKDALDANGNIKPQGIDVSFLVATLTAALQEQQAIIESLKARLDAANL